MKILFTQILIVLTCYSHAQMFSHEGNIIRIKSENASFESDTLEHFIMVDLDNMAMARQQKDSTIVFSLLVEKTRTETDEYIILKVIDDAGEITMFYDHKWFNECTMIYRDTIYVGNCKPLGEN
ncbi:MAG: hypothetical protein WED10_06400 [Brumimicrobium sp.]